MHNQAKLTRAWRALEAAKALASGRDASQLEEMNLHISGYAEPGYDAGECGIVATGNWNDNGTGLVERLGAIFERMGIECEWSDEWSTCDCGKLVRHSPDCHHWEPSYIVTEGSIVCNDCAGEPTFERWDVLLAYWHAAHGWNGTRQAADIRARLERLKYKPSHREEYSENISVNAALILRAIDKRAREERW